MTKSKSGKYIFGYCEQRYYLILSLYPILKQNYRNNVLRANKAISIIFMRYEIQAERNQEFTENIPILLML